MWSYIKKAINSNISKTLDTLIDEVVGSEGDTSSTTGSVHAKIKALRNTPISPIKSIQRGTTSVEGTIDVTISSVDMSKATVNLTTSYFNAGTNSIKGTLRALLTSATNLQLEVDGAQLSGARTVTWEVIEYV